MCVSIKAHLWQEIGVCSDAKCKEASIANLGNWAKAPVHDPHICQTLSKRKFTKNGAKNRTMLAKEDFKHSCGPSLLLAHCGRATNWSTTFEGNWIW